MDPKETARNIRTGKVDSGEPVILEITPAPAGITGLSLSGSPPQFIGQLDSETAPKCLVNLSLDELTQDV